MIIPSDAISDLNKTITIISQIYSFLRPYRTVVAVKAKGERSPSQQHTRRGWAILMRIDSVRWMWYITEKVTICGVISLVIDREC